ncbi:MAG: hypothetical protein HXX09_10710 [Bacteroidetes bacterium]|nr:hypothetical protein [Bacteroidota bacterium]
MRTLLICNNIKTSIDFISNKIKNDWIKTAEADKRKSQDINISSNKYFEIISEKSIYENFNFEKFNPEIIFIVPEINWERNGLNDGYKIALDILTDKLKNQFFQLVFLSVIDYENLFKNSEKDDRPLIEVFPHFDLLDNKATIGFDNYSEIHFKLIKLLVVSSKGRILRVEHDIGKYHSNFSGKDSEGHQNIKLDLFRQIDELSLFQVWTTQSMSELYNELENSRDLKEINAVFYKIGNCINEIKTNLPNEKSVENKKSDFNVLIIEDDERYRNLFSEIFSQFYHVVNPNLKGEIEMFPQYVEKANSKIVGFDINDAIDIISTQAKKYQIIILDLLYKRKNGSWLPFNGLDLYLLVRRINPHAAIRLITSLPREVVGKIIKTTIQEEIPLSHVFTKKVGYEELKNNIEDRIDEINLECRKKEKSKSVYSHFPKAGVFNWPSIPGLMNDLMNSRQKVYYEARKQSMELFELYRQKQLTIETKNWKKGELPSLQKKNSVEQGYFLDKLPKILTHRLIAIDQACKHPEFKIMTQEYLDILKYFTNISAINKSYFTSKLGFNGTDYDVIDPQYNYFQISFENLFPEEINIIINELSKNKEDLLLKDFNNDLYLFFSNILCDLKTYENWDELKLDFNPYIDKSYIDNKGEITLSQISKDLTFKKLENFLLSLINNYSNSFVEDIAIIVTNIGIHKALIKNTAISILIDNLYEIDSPETSEN